MVVFMTEVANPVKNLSVIEAVAMTMVVPSMKTTGNMELAPIVSVVAVSVVLEVLVMAVAMTAAVAAIAADRGSFHSFASSHEETLSRAPFKISEGLNSHPIIIGPPFDPPQRVLRKIQVFGTHNDT